MATFEVLVVQLDSVGPIPGADRLEVASYEGQTAVVQKGAYQPGDRVLWVPENSIVPNTVLGGIPLKGNRVRSMKIRGVLSEALVLPAPEGIEIGTNVAEMLGITKHVQHVPETLTGDVDNVGDVFPKYDIDALKQGDRTRLNGISVTVTEKLHGTFMVCGVVDGRVLVASKGRSHEGLAFKPDVDNSYTRVEKNLLLGERLKQAFPGETVFLFGEVFGPGIQKGFHYGQAEAVFRAFDIYVGPKGKGRFLNDVELDLKLREMNLTRVPVLYRGPFSADVVRAFVSGRETLTGSHIREGIVVRPQIEMENDRRPLGREGGKIVSSEYKGKTDKTEYQ